LIITQPSPIVFPRVVDETVGYTGAYHFVGEFRDYHTIDGGLTWILDTVTPVDVIQQISITRDRTTFPGKTALKLFASDVTGNQPAEIFYLTRDFQLNLTDAARGVIGWDTFNNGNPVYSFRFTGWA